MHGPRPREGYPHVTLIYLRFPACLAPARGPRLPGITAVRNAGRGIYSSVTSPGKRKAPPGEVGPGLWGCLRLRRRALLAFALKLYRPQVDQALLELAQAALLNQHRAALLAGV